MTDVKWIKIMVDIFDDEKIQVIEALPSADTIIVIWFKLLCLAGKTNSNGVLIMNDRIAYTDEMLAAIFRRKVTDVRMALETFKQYGMVEIIENTYVIPNWGKHQSLDYHERKKEYDREYHRQQRLEQKKIIDGVNEEEKCRTTNVRTSNDLSLSISYSYISNLNIDNLNHLISNNIYKDTEYIVNNDRLLGSVREWMEYKDSKRPKTQHHYDTERGLSKLLTSVINQDKENGTDYVVECIDSSMANNYSGIVWSQPKRKRNSGLDTSAIDNW